MHDQRVAASAGPLAPVARRVRIRGVVQGVGFRPYVYRLALECELAGWVVNDPDGVEIHVQGTQCAVDSFLGRLTVDPPAAADIADVHVSVAGTEALQVFEIRESRTRGAPTARISVDLPVCEACLGELFDRRNRRAGYAYINCTNCGPRYSIIHRLPYDRPHTTMAAWPLCPDCDREYRDPLDRRFHAQPVACPACGPAYRLASGADAGCAWDTRADPVAEAARLLREGAILAVKGIGGYHLACDAGRPESVAELRLRKYRKEQAFAVMVRDVETARETCVLEPDAEALLRSAARPIVLARARIRLPEVAPHNADLGVMLPYAPVHHLLFAHGAPRWLVMTSGNRSTEPIAFDDADAFDRLSGLADAFLVGERPIARRVDDSIARVGATGPMILRRSRGWSPGVVASLPSAGPILAVGADLKNTIALVVEGRVSISQHIGTLSHHGARVAHQRTIDDLTAMYGIDWSDLLVVHDRHPQYVSTGLAAALRCRQRIAVQHHRAHIASVLAERQALDLPVLGIALDGTGYGDDGGIWGGELFAGSVEEGFARVAHLRPAALPGGDAAAAHPVQAAAGFLDQVDPSADLSLEPFRFPERYRQASALVRRRVRTFQTTSAGRLFDTVAAIAGFTRAVTYEAQAAIWLEHLARPDATTRAYPFPFDGEQIDWRPALAAAIHDRRSGVDPATIARAFHRGFAGGMATAALQLLDRFELDTVCLTGGVLQNDLLLSEMAARLGAHGVRVWTNAAVPPNDGGISLGQAALAACGGVDPACPVGS